MPDLQSLEGMFSASREGSSQVALGKPINFKLSPTNLSDVKLTTVVPGDMNLTWISKNVLFENEGIETVFTGNTFDVNQVDSLILGELPVRLPRVTGVATGLLNEQINGVQGLLSQLRGSIPLVMDAQVQVSVVWRVFDSETSTTPLTSGFTSLGSMNAFEISILFEPAIVELTTSTAIPTVDRFIEAEVTLSLGGTSGTPFKLPRLKVTVPAIPVPRLVAFFLHRDFQPRSGDDDGALFIVVPNNSPLRSLTQLQGALNTLESTLGSLTAFASFASFLIGLQDIVNAINAQPHIQIRVADGSNNFDNFNDVTLKEHWAGFLFGWSNTEAEDELSSMLYLAPPRSALGCFNARDRGTGEGDFTITTGILCHAKVSNLHSATPSVAPSDASLAVNTRPPGGLFNPSTFGDSLSSLSFL